MNVVCELPLQGAGGEPISFERTVYSHGCAGLPPAAVESSPLLYRRSFRAGTRVVEVAMRERAGKLVAETPAKLGTRAAAGIAAEIATMFRLDEDLTPFYASIAGDELLGWAADGAGRILASPTVFEDVVKTICTTNCAWSATVRMTRALSELGEGAFPGPERMAAAPESWYRDAARAGYRGEYLQNIAGNVVAGTLDLESLRSFERFGDDEVEEQLLELPGIGPYGTAHVMQLLGRHRRLVLDSWTRPKYLRVSGKRRAADSTIERAFARYGKYAGLAFWLYLTRDWIEEDVVQ
ncbi:MAG TPA: hypothetical protein VHR97_06950 [Candidatus Baltobacteraceae bacterium]|nr:hypothetical protein [Candidatus Baltobacteraceae bacterium]